MQIIKTNEKILIWAHREKLTMQKIADGMGITRQYLGKKMKDNLFTESDMVAIRSIGFKDY